MRRAKLEILYSIGIITAIPLLLALNTVLLISATRSAFNQELRRKADLVNAVIAENSIEDIKSESYDTLSQKLSQLELAQPAVRQSQIVVKVGNEFKQIAHGQESSDQLNPSRELQISIAYERKLPIAQFINISDDGRTSQAWNVVTPVLDNGEVIAVINSSIVTSDAEEAIDKAYTSSFVVMIISIVVIVGLLFRHFRLVGYVQLLAKQKELNQTMNDFLSVATHELKAPTSIIKGYISNVLDGTSGPVNEKINEQLNTALAQTDRLNTLVKDLLNVSHIDQGRIEYNSSDVDSSKVLGLIVENYRLIASQKSLVLEYKPLESSAFIHVDEGRLQEIFTNLIDNAIKYTVQGTVTVAQYEEDSKIVTSIKDTGFGMSPEARKRLFQRFYRIKTENTKTIGGTGLGLWIIKQYIVAMGGTIEVESLEGAGSNFIVMFPKI
jgi:signal transduction histidine kinase